MMLIGTICLYNFNCNCRFIQIIIEYINKKTQKEKYNRLTGERILESTQKT